MNETFTTRLAGLFALLAMVAEFAALGIGMSQGFRGGQLNLGDASTLAGLNQTRWVLTPLFLAIAAPILFVPAWAGMLRVLRPAGAWGPFGILVATSAMVLGVVAESIRFSLAASLPPIFVASAETARPAILAFAAVLGRTYSVLDNLSIILLFAVGVPLIAVAILRAGELPRWLGWTVLPPSLVAGFLGAPLLLVGQPIGGLILLASISLYFLWVVALGVMLLVWRPRDAAGSAPAS